MAKRQGMHATMACYTFFERSWHAKCQSMSKNVKMGDPAYGGHAIGKRARNSIIHLLRRSPIGRVNGRTLVRYWNTSVAQWRLAERPRRGRIWRVEFEQELWKSIWQGKSWILLTLLTTIQLFHTFHILLKSFTLHYIFNYRGQK